MPWLGRGALVIWHDVHDETDYNEWHSKEHMLERVGVPGFRRGMRYVAVAESPKYLNLRGRRSRDAHVQAVPRFVSTIRRRGPGAPCRACTTTAARYAGWSRATAAEASAPFS